MIIRKNFYSSWLAFGLLQLCLAINSVQSQANSDTLFSSKPTDMPVRIPRSFFYQSLVGTLTAQVISSNQLIKLDSAINWNEEPTTEAAPGPGAIADFRDHLGCAYYSNLSNIAVCFNVMGDVYSLGVNAKEVQLQGIENLLNKELIQKLNLGDCSYQIQNVQFIQASRDKNQVALQFSGDAIPQTDCKNTTQAILVTLKMREM